MVVAASSVRLTFRVFVAAIAAVVIAHPMPAWAQSALDGFDPNANGSVETVAVQADGKVLIGGNFTAVGGANRYRIARLNVDGSLDATFNPGANNIVRAIAVQADGKILVGGNFTMLGGGGTGTTPRRFLGRLNADGSIDSPFDPGADDIVRVFAVQANGQILLGGNFFYLGGGTGTIGRRYFGRLNADGSVDPAFNPGANSDIFAVALQPDGKILVGGMFQTLGGGGTGTSMRYRIGRLHADGSLDTSFNPGANGAVRALAVQPDGAIIAGGEFTGLGGATGVTPRSRVGRLKSDGSVDPGFNPGANADVRSILVQRDGNIVVGGGFATVGGGTGTTPRLHIARFTSSGGVDERFNPTISGSVDALAQQPDAKILTGGFFETVGNSSRNNIARLYVSGVVDAEFGVGADGVVFAFTVQPDARIVVGGKFTSFDGIVATRVARFDADGSIDGEFLTKLGPGPNNDVLALALQADGRILLAGAFTCLCEVSSGFTTRHIARLDADGSKDSTFSVPNTNGSIFAVAVQTDGSILIGGTFSAVGPFSRNGIARLGANGALDSTFDPGANGLVHSIVVQPDGRILVGGYFTMLGGGGTGITTRNRLGRLNADGSLDTSFNPGASEIVRALELQPNGQILVGGKFTTLAGVARSRIGRLNADGSIDPAFDPGANADVWTLVQQSDGTIVVGGEFTALGGGGSGVSVRNRVGRLTSTGSIDATFDPGADGAIYALTLQADGKVLVGGAFTTLGDGGTGATLRSRIGRLTNTNAAVESLTISNGVLTWLRSGTGPEFTRVTFELSTDAATYSSLGTGIRAMDGWQLGGLLLDGRRNLFIRARGYASGAQSDASTSIIESISNVYRDGIAFTDEPIVAGATAVKAIHVAELRSRIDSVRARYGLAPYGYTDPTIASHAPLIRAQHIIEMRAALREAYEGVNATPPAYVDGNLMPGTTVRAIHITELRASVFALQ